MGTWVLHTSSVCVCCGGPCSPPWAASPQTTLGSSSLPAKAEPRGPRLCPQAVPRCARPACAFPAVHRPARLCSPRTRVCKPRPWCVQWHSRVSSYELLSVGWDISVPWLVMEVAQRRPGTAWPHPPRRISPLPDCTGAQPPHPVPHPFLSSPRRTPGVTTASSRRLFPPPRAARGAAGAGIAGVARAPRGTSFTDGQVLRYIMDNSQREDAINNTDTYRGKKVHT